MKNIVIVANILLLAAFGYLLFENGLPKKHEAFVFLALVAPAVTLYFLFFPPATIEKPEGVLRLFLKRKALEEKQRIAELQKSQK